MKIKVVLYPFSQDALVFMSKIRYELNKVKIQPTKASIMSYALYLRL